MSTAKTLGLVALGYALAVACGIGLVAVNEMRMSEDIAEGSPGMVAFGDMILFVVAVGVFGLVPTWFLLRLAVAKAPRLVLGALLLIAVSGPPSWLAVMLLAGTPPPNPMGSAPELVGLLIAFAAIPRIVAGPVVMAIEAGALLLLPGRVTRALLAAAILMDLVPLTLYALRMAGAADR
jgi:hypothetical protein